MLVFSISAINIPNFQLSSAYGCISYKLQFSLSFLKTMKVTIILKEQSILFYFACLMKYFWILNFFGMSQAGKNTF